MKKIAMVLIVGLIALAMILPATAAGQGGNGKMMQSGAGMNGIGCQNPDCPQVDCPNNQTPPRDGTGLQYGKNIKTGTQ